MHTAAASLVRESGVLHGVRANAGFDVPLEDSVCLDGVSGNLQVDAGAAPSRRVPHCGQRDSAFCETDRLHEMLECSAASSFAAETDQLQTESESSGARVCLPFGHSAWRSRVRGLRLRREAHSRSGNFVVDSLSSSRHVDHVHTLLVAHMVSMFLHDARTNSCLVTHAARVNSFGLHGARGNSGGHIHSYRCTKTSCGGVRGGTKPMSLSTRCQVGCPAVEKLAAPQQAPGRLHVETWAGRNGNPSLPISQVVETMSGCADMVTRLPPPFFSSVSPGPGREVRNGMGWSLSGETARPGVW